MQHNSRQHIISKLKNRDRLGQSLDEILKIVKQLGDGVKDAVRENAFSKLAEQVENYTNSLTILAQRNEGLQRSLNLNVQAAAKLGGILDNTAVTLGINSSKLRTYSTELDKVVKGYSQFISKGGETNDVLLKQYNRYRDVLGLTEEQSVALTKFSIVQGKANGSTEKFNDELAQVAASIAKETGRTGVYADILTQIADAGPEIYLAYGKSAQTLGQAAAKASRLGVSFKDLVKTSNQFLDIESSISSELELQLLGGKKINSEKFRQAAITQDVNGMADALTEIIESQGEGIMTNIYQRQALSKQLGIEEGQLLEIYANLQTNAAMSGKTTAQYQQQLEAAKDLTEQSKITAESQAKAESVLTIQAEQRNKANLQYTKSINNALEEQYKNQDLNPLTKQEKHINDIYNLINGEGGLADTILDLAPKFQEKLNKLIESETLSTILGAASVGQLAIDAYNDIKNANFNADNVYIEGTIAGGKTTPANDIFISPSAGTIVAGAFGAFSLNPGDNIIASPNVENPAINTSTQPAASPAINVIIQGNGLDELISKIEMRQSEQLNA